MRRAASLLLAAALLLSGCAPDRPPLEGTWKLFTAQSQEDGAVVACAPGRQAGDGARQVDVTMTVGDGTFSITGGGSGTDGTWQRDGRFCTFDTGAASGPASCSWTAYADGSRRATLIVTPGAYAMTFYPADDFPS